MEKTMNQNVRIRDLTSLCRSGSCSENFLKQLLPILIATVFLRKNFPVKNKKGLAKFDKKNAKIV